MADAALTKARMVALYTKHNADKLKDIDDLLVKYAGREDGMWGGFRKKYGEAAVAEAWAAAEPAAADDAGSAVQELAAAVAGGIEDGGEEGEEDAFRGMMAAAADGDFAGGEAAAERDLENMAAERSSRASLDLENMAADGGDDDGADARSSRASLDLENMAAADGGEDDALLGELVADSDGEPSSPEAALVPEAAAEPMAEPEKVAEPEAAPAAEPEKRKNRFGWSRDKGSKGEKKASPDAADTAAAAAAAPASPKAEKPKRKSMFDWSKGSKEEKEASAAATKIQARSRGATVRTGNTPPRPGTGNTPPRPAADDAAEAPKRKSMFGWSKGSKEEMEASAAATKIQARSRGAKARKEKKGWFGSSCGGEVGSESEVEGELEVAPAATPPPPELTGDELAAAQQAEAVAKAEAEAAARFEARRRLKAEHEARLSELEAKARVLRLKHAADLDGAADLLEGLPEPEPETTAEEHDRVAAAVAASLALNARLTSKVAALEEERARVALKVRRYEAATKEYTWSLTGWLGLDSLLGAAAGNNGGADSAGAAQPKKKEAWEAGGDEGEEGGVGGEAKAAVQDAVTVALGMFNRTADGDYDTSWAI